nr:DUF6431 domain-containing protein [Brevibacillus parabrevis]
MTNKNSEGEKKKRLLWNGYCGNSITRGVFSLSTWSLYQNIRSLKRSREAAFFVKSAEQVAAPCCGGCLCVVGSRPRAWFQSAGEKRKLIIRRLYCEMCGRIHHELPDILVPYKRYDAESIEVVVSEPTRTDIAADESTLYRWKCWFVAWAVYAAGCLESIAKRLKLPVVEPSARPQTVLSLLGRFVGDAAGWLKRAVRPIANSHLWVTDPFCLPVRPLSE